MFKKKKEQKKSYDKRIIVRYCAAAFVPENRWQAFKISIQANLRKLHGYETVKNWMNLWRCMT